MSKVLQLPVLVTSISSRVDKSVKISMETRELNSTDAAELFSLRGVEAWAFLSPSEQAEFNIPESTPDPSIQKKSPSKRFHDRLFVYYMKVLNGKEDEFNYWYERELEKLGQKYLEKITE